MKFTCDKTILLKKIAEMKNIPINNNPHSILSNVLIQTEKNSIVMRLVSNAGTNSSSFLNFETHTPVKVQEQGSTAVNYKELSSILRRLPKGNVNFSTQELKDEGERFVISPYNKTIDFKLKTRSIQNYPEMLQADDKAISFDISQSDFIEMVSKTIFAILLEDSNREYMTGAHFEKANEKLIMVATNGHRLASVTMKAHSSVADFSVIVPREILRLVKKLSKKGVVSIGIDKAHVFMEFDNQKLVSPLISHEGFPINYEKLIPINPNYNITINRKKFIEAIKSISIFIDKTTNQMVVEVFSGSITIYSGSSYLGDLKEKVSCNYEGEPANILVNFEYLLESLQEIDTEEVQIQFNGKFRDNYLTSPIKLIPVIEQDFFCTNSQHDYLNLIMPMNP